MIYAHTLPCMPNCPPAIVRVVKIRPKVDLNRVYAIGYGGTTGRYEFAPIGSS